MSDKNGRRVVSLADARPVTRGEIDRDLDVIASAMHQRQDAMSMVLTAHHQVLQRLEAQTIKGRIRRAKARLELWRLTLRGYAVELNILAPLPASAPRPDLDNPEAIPKV